MARVKKNETALTLEEKLDRALVPDWEWPNKLPENWCWVRLGTLISSSKENTSNFSTDMKYVGLEHIEKDSGKIEYGSAENVKSLKNKFCAGQILYGKLRPYLNKHGIPTFDGVCSTDILVFDTQKITIAKYINFFFDTRDFLEYTISNSRGVNLPRVSETTILEAKCPLAPLPEQQRIVDRIESLFAKLDEAKEKAQATLDSFETRKAAILHKAFTGELIGKEEVKTVLLEKVVETIRIGPFGSALHQEDYITNGIPVINPKHIIGQQIKPEAKVTISADKAFELSSYMLRENDVILGRRGEMGRSAPIGQQQKGWICGTGSMIIRLKTGYDASFYSQIIGSQSVVQYLEENCVGSTLKNLNEKIVRHIPIPDFTVDEQQRLQKVLENLLDKENRAKEAAENVLEQIDLMKKAILSRAFRGELGTNDPTEESALELLKSILVDEKQEAKDKPDKRRIAIPKHIAVRLSTVWEKAIVMLLYKEETHMLPLQRLMLISSDKFALLKTIKRLQKKGIIEKMSNGNYRLVEEQNADQTIQHQQTPVLNELQY